MDGTFRLDLIIRKYAVVLELLACKDKALDVCWNSLYFLDLRLDNVDGVIRLDLKGNSLTRQGLDECMHPPSQSQDWATNNKLLRPNQEFKEYRPRWRVDSFWML